MGAHVRTASGSSLYVEETGTGPVVLAIHGLGGGAYFFRALAPHLESRHRVIAVDLPGTGRSTSAHPFTAASWIRDLLDVAAAKSDAPVTIVGHSLGAILALKMLDADPRLVRALVFVGGLPEVRPLIRERLQLRPQAIRADGIVGWGEKVSAGVFSPATLRQRPEVVGLFERLFEAQDPEVYIRALEILLGMSAASVLPAVRVPCFAVTGADDQYAPPESVEAFMRQIPGDHRTAVLAACGHLPFFEAPDRFGQVVRDFLDRL